LLESAATVPVVVDEEVLGVVVAVDEDVLGVLLATEPLALVSALRLPDAVVEELSDFEVSDFARLSVEVAAVSVVDFADVSFDAIVAFVSVDDLAAVSVEAVVSVEAFADVSFEATVLLLSVADVSAVPAVWLEEVEDVFRFESLARASLLLLEELREPLALPEPLRLAEPLPFSELLEVDAVGAPEALFCANELSVEVEDDGDDELLLNEAEVFVLLF
jgi:hypothetical protein